MHESMVLASCRGQTRQLKTKSAEHFARLADSLCGVRKRKPWLNAILKALSEDPGTIILDVQTLGNSIKSATVLVTLVGITERKEEPWQIVQYRVCPRDYSVNHVASRLTITWHVITRVMQREKIQQVSEALTFMAPAFAVATVLIDHPDQEVMVPCGSGAMVMAWGTQPHETKQRILKTYIDREKLAPAQIERLGEMWKFAVANTSQAVGGLG